MSLEFHVGDRTFRARKLPGLLQVRLLKRAAPVVGPLMAVTGAPESEIIAVAVSSLAELDDDALEFILARTLASVEMKDGQGWARIAANDDRLSCNYDEIADDVHVMFSIAAQVIKYNFTPLFHAALSSLPGGATPTLHQ